MRIGDSTRSRIVAWLKILLPLAALALLSTLFLVARTVDPAQQLPFADVDVEEIAREERIGSPEYSGVTAEGAAIALSATSASPAPNDPNRVTGMGVRAEIDLPDGEKFAISAGNMQVDYSKGTVALRDDIRINSGSGYEIRTGALDVALNSTRVESDSKTTLTGAIGNLSANSFRLSATDDTNTSYVLVFKGDVKLVYNPEE